MDRQRVTAVLAVALLLVAAIGGVASVATADRDGASVASHEDDDGTEREWDDEQETGWNGSADEAYVTDDGDVILVVNYDDAEAEDDPEADEDHREVGSDPFEDASGHAGVNVSAGLAHLLVTGEDVDSNVTGDLTLWASPDEVAANGTLSTPKPEWLTDLEVNVTSLQNDTDKRASMDLGATIALTGQTRALNVVEDARTSGFVTTDATSLRANGSASIELPLSFQPDRSHHVALTEDDGDYTLSVEESYRLKPSFDQPDPTEGWENRSAAKRTLQEQFCDAETTAVDCSVSVETYDLTEGDTPRLTLAYTVSIDGVDAALSDAIVQGLTAESTELNVTESEATGLAARVENVTIDRIEASYVDDGGDTGVGWHVSLQGKDDLTLAYADVLELLERAAAEGQFDDDSLSAMGGTFGTPPGEVAERLRKQVAASEATDVSQTSRWNVSLQTDDDVATLDGSYTMETTNWQAYVEERARRGVDVERSASTSLSARTDGDRIVLAGATDVERDGLVERALDAMNETLASSEANATKVSEVFDTIDRSNFTRARMDVALTQSNWTLEGAVAVENGTVLSEALSEPLDRIDATYTSIDERRTVLRLDGAFEDEPAVRALALVDNETEIYLAGDWEPAEQSFGSLDVDYVETYLGLHEDGEDGGIPLVVIAGGGLAITAAAGGGIVLFRQWG